MSDWLSLAKSNDPHIVVLTMDVHLSYFRDEYNFEEALRLLPFEWQCRVIQKRAHKDKVTALCNRLLQLYGCRLELNTQAIDFTQGKYGKPFVKNTESFNFSMTNGENFVSIIMTNLFQTEVGIDLASINDFTSEGDLKIYEDVLSTEEYEKINNQTNLLDMKRLFAFYWSVKECYTKYLGFGLNGDLKNINVSLFSAPLVNEAVSTFKLKDITFHSRWVSDNEILTYCFPAQYDFLKPIHAILNVVSVIEGIKTQFLT